MEISIFTSDDGEGDAEWGIEYNPYVIIMAYRHIPTMTKAHHGEEMSVMIKVGMCQYQTTIHDKLQQLALVSYSTRPQC